MTTLHAEGVLFPEGPGDELAQSIERLDTSSAIFFQTAYEYSRWPIQIKQQRMGVAAQAVFEAYKGAARSIALTEEDSENQSRMILELLLDSDIKRVDTLNAITGQAVFIKSTIREKEESVLDSIKTGLEQDAEPGSEDKKIEYPLGLFCAYLNADLEAFQNHVRAGKRGKIVELGRTGARHALDVAKAAAGMSLALYAAKLIEKNQQS